LQFNTGYNAKYGGSYNSKQYVVSFSFVAMHRVIHRHNMVLFISDSSEIYGGRCFSPVVASAFHSACLLHQ
jgi:hypothetical protein